MKSQHVELPHEEIFKQFGIDPSTLPYEKSLKPIPKSWLLEIINNAIVNVENNNPFNTIFKKKERTFVLTFDSENIVIDFHIEFRDKVFEELNAYIKIKKHDPLDYNRAAIITIEPKGNQIVIRVP